MRKIIAGILLCISTIPADAASAVLNGVRLTCREARAVYVLPTLPRYYAQADMRRRIIYLGARELAGMSRSELRYVMAHECGHLVHGGSHQAVEAYAARRVRPSARLCRITGACRG